MERLTIGALVTIDVHARDVVTLLVELGIDNKLDFDWLSQLRYALEDGNVHIDWNEFYSIIIILFLGESMVF